MFMIDMHGTLARATASSSSRTPGERYCGSCIASATMSYSPGLGPALPPAGIFPGSLFLRLLHRGRDVVFFAGLGPRRAARGHLPRELLRVDLDQALAALDRHAHHRPLLVYQVGLGGEADQMDIVSGERELGPQQRTV